MSAVKNIPDGWVETTLGEIAYTNQNCIDRNYNFKEISYLDTGSITEGVIDSYQVMNYNESPSRAKRLVKDGDIVYSSVRPNLKHYGYIRNPQNNLVVSTGFVVVSSKANQNSKFIYYWLTQNSNTNYLHQLAEQSTSTYPSIKPTDLENLKIVLPINIDEQKSIAAILTAFDDKIELLQAQNKTLEETAQTIFKEWFGKYQIGDKLPEGWREGKLGEVTIHVKDNIKPFDNPEKQYVHFSLPSYDDGLKPVVEKGNMIKSNKYAVVSDSFLVSKLNPFTPRIWTIYESEENYICSTEFQVVKPISELYFTIIHCFLNSDDFTKELSQKIKGTSSSHQRVNPQDIFDVKLIIPNNTDLVKFDECLKPILQKKNINHTQIQTLTQTRDELLPKLMSGEIRVNEFNQ